MHVVLAKTVFTHNKTTQKFRVYFRTEQVDTCPTKTMLHYICTILLN